MANEFQNLIDDAIDTLRNGGNAGDVQNLVGRYGLTVEDIRPALRIRSRGESLPDAGIGRAAAQGATFGFADEIEGAWDAATGDGNYSDYRDVVRASNKFYAEENPWKANIAEAVGGLATGGAGLARSVGRQGVKLGARELMKQGAKQGSIEGAAYGVGASDEDDIGGVLADAAMGAGSGLVLGGSLPGAVSAYGKYRGRAIGADEKAMDIVEGYVGDIENASNQALKQAGRDMSVGARPSGMLADTSDTAAAGTRALRTSDKEAGQVIDEALNARYLPDMMSNEGGQLERMRGNLNRVGGNVGESLDDMAKRRAKEAQINYAAAKAETPEVPTDFLAPYLDNPQFRKAYEQAKIINDNARTLGETAVELPPLNKLIDAETGEILIDTLPLESVDFIKRGLDSFVNSNAEGLSSLIRGQVRQMKNRMLSDLDSINPQYANARQKFADVSSVMEAGVAGQDFTKVSNPELKSLWQSFNAPQKQAYKQQALEAVNNMLTRPTDNADLVKRLAGNVQARENLRTILGDEDYTKLAKSLIREARQVKTRQTVMGGSNTADKLAEAKSLDDQFGSALSMLVSGEIDIPGKAVSTIRDFVGKPITKTRKEAVRKAAEVMTETDPNKITQNVQNARLFRSTRKERERKATDRALRALPRATRSALGSFTVDYE